MKKSTIVLFVSLIVLFVGCSANNSSNPMLDPIPEKGENPLPLMPNADFTKIIKQPVDSLRAKSNHKVDLNQLKPLLERAQKELGKDHVAVFSLKDSTGSWYSYYVEELIFPDSLIDKAHSQSSPYLYYQESRDGNPPRVAIAMIPSNATAYSMFDDWIQPNGESNTTSKFKGCTYEEVAPGGFACWESDPVLGEGGCTYTPPTYDYVCEFSEPEVYDWPTSGGGGGFGSDPTPEPTPECEVDEVMDDSGNCIVETDDVELWEVEKIIDDELDPCMKSIIQDLKGVEKGVGEIIQKFAGEVPGYNWELKSGDLGGSNAQTSQRYNSTTGTVTTTFDPQRFTNGTDLSVARTILHEAIHAYLISYFRTDPILASEAYQTMVNELMKGKYPEQNSLQHAEFVRSFITDIGDALQQFGSNRGYSISSTYYQKLAWGGLTHWLKRDESGEVIKDASGNPVYEETPWFKAEYPTLEERESVNNIILTEQGINNNENQKGTDANC